MNQNDRQQFIGVTRQVHYLGALVLENRIARALDEGAARYPIYRVLRFHPRQNWNYHHWQPRGS